MSDSGWQSAVLHELGVAQRGFAASDLTAGRLLSGDSGMAPIHDAPPAEQANAADAPSAVPGQPPASPAQPPHQAPHTAPHQAPHAVPQAPAADPRPSTPPAPAARPEPQVPSTPAEAGSPHQDGPPSGPQPAPVQTEPQADPVQQQPAAQQEPAAENSPPYEIPLVGFPEELLNDAGADAATPAPAQGEQATPQPAAPSPVPHQPVPPAQGRVEAADLVAKNRHGDPLMRRVGRSMRRAVGAGAQDLRQMGEIADLLGRQTSYRQIAVVSVRGGAGKTTMAAMLSTEFARHRTDRVLAVDADAELGSLPLRLGVRTNYSLFDLAGQHPQSFEEASRYLAQTRDGLWVLAATRGGSIAGEFTLETFQAALGAVNRYFSVAVVDCGAGILTQLHSGILSTTHAQVLVTPATVDGALSARGALEWFAANGRGALLTRTVIAMVTHAPHGGADIDRAVGMLSEGGMQVVLVPYDRHLATGGATDLDKVGGATRKAATRVAAEVFARALGLAGVRQ